MSVYVTKSNLTQDNYIYTHDTVCWRAVTKPVVYGPLYFLTRLNEYQFQSCIVETDISNTVEIDYSFLMLYYRNTLSTC